MHRFGDVCDGLANNARTQRPHRTLLVGKYSIEDPKGAEFAVPNTIDIALSSLTLLLSGGTACEAFANYCFLNQPPSLRNYSQSEIKHVLILAARSPSFPC